MKLPLNIILLALLVVLHYPVNANTSAVLAELVVQDRQLVPLLVNGKLPQSGMLTFLSKQLFITEVEAVLAASNRFNPYSMDEDREYIGIIVRSDGIDGEQHYLYTVASGGVGDDTVAFSLMVPLGYQLSAFWHTHGAAHWTREYFSGNDTALANSWNVPMYLASHTGKLQVFHPGDSVMNSGARGFSSAGLIQGISKGAIVRAYNEPLTVTVR